MKAGRPVLMIRRDGNELYVESTAAPIRDEAGKVVGATTTWVLGGVPAENRTWFETRVPAAASYRVEVVSFDWIGRGGGGM